MSESRLAALAWIDEQRHPPRRHNGATITPDADYKPFVQQVVQGGLTLDDPGAYPIIYPAVEVTDPLPIPPNYGGFETYIHGLAHPAQPLVNGALYTPVLVDAPMPIPPNYDGTISGRVVGYDPASVSYKVQGYLYFEGDTRYLQAEGTVNPDGTWSLGAAGRSGLWTFRLVNVSTGEQVGNWWLQPYQSLYVTQYTVRGYLTFPDTDPTLYLQGEVPVLSDGTWHLNAKGRSGEWRFQLYAGSTAEGSMWTPQTVAVRAHLQWELHEWADINYLHTTGSVTEDGRWSFHVRGKYPVELRLVDTRDSRILARWATRTNWVRSFAASPVNSVYGTVYETRCAVYDQALAVLAQLDHARTDPLQTSAATERAYDMAMAMVARQDPLNGAFPVSLFQLQVSGIYPYYRTGPIAWAVYALLKCYRADRSHQHAAAVRDSAVRGLQWLIGRKQAGYDLLDGGTGKHQDPGPFDPSYVHTNSSTENNIDAWFTFALAYQVLGEPRYAAMAIGIKRSLLRLAVRSDGQGFWQGVTAEGQPDQQGALDCYSWGAILLTQWGRSALAGAGLDRAESLYRTTDGAGRIGYKPYTALEGYSGCNETNVWYEGSFGVVVARARCAREWVSLRDLFAAEQQADGSFVYSTEGDAVYEMTTMPSIASSAWFLFSLDPMNALWTEADLAFPIEATDRPFYADPFGEGESSDRLQHAIDLGAEDLRTGAGPGIIDLPPGIYSCANSISIPQDVGLLGFPNETLLQFPEGTLSPVVWAPPAEDGSAAVGAIENVLVQVGSDTPYLLTRPSS